MKGNQAQTVYKFSFSRLKTRSKQQGTKDLLARGLRRDWHRTSKNEGGGGWGARHLDPRPTAYQEHKQMIPQLLLLTKTPGQNPRNYGKDPQGVCGCVLCDWRATVCYAAMCCCTCVCMHACVHSCMYSFAHAFVRAFVC